MRNLLHLHPHLHTGKLLHHRHTSYRSLFLIVALTGAILVTPVGMAKADSYKVNAIVPAPLPDGPAVIIHPNGDTVYSPSVPVTGTCPTSDPAIIVVIYEGSMILGSQACSAIGTFNLPIRFLPGTHVIYAQIINFTGQTGASSVPVTFKYLLPGTVTTTENPSESISEPLEVISKSPFLVFGVRKDAIWDITISGGTGPYTATIRWGDGQTQTIRKLAVGDHTFSHHYDVMRTHKVTISVQDNFGGSASRTITAVTPAVFSAYPTNPVQRPSMMWLLYLIYIFTVLLLIFMWRRHKLTFGRQLVVVPIAKRRRQPQQMSQIKRHR